MVRDSRRWMAATATATVVLAMSLPPSLAAMRQFNRYDSQIRADSIPGRFTPATGDSRLIARYAQLPDEVKRKFSFTPALHPDSKANQKRAITVVVRSRNGSVDSIAASVASSMDIAEHSLDALADGAGVGVLSHQLLPHRLLPQRFAVVPVVFNLGAAVGYQKFAPTAPARSPARTIVSAVTPSVIGETYDLRNLPTAIPPKGASAKTPSRFVSRVIPMPTKAVEAAVATGQSFDLSGSYRLSRNIELTAGVRYSPDENRLRPLSDARRDSQAVYIGTQFRF